MPHDRRRQDARRRRARRYAPTGGRRFVIDAAISAGAVTVNENGALRIVGVRPTIGR